MLQNSFIIKQKKRDSKCVNKQGIFVGRMVMEVYWSGGNEGGKGDRATDHEYRNERARGLLTTVIKQGVGHVWFQF